MAKKATIAKKKKSTKKTANSNLHKAKEVKNDEFYTMLEDIENELYYYKKFFKDKIIFCNCDDPSWSNFWTYFKLKFDDFGLKKLISTHFDAKEPTYKLTFDGKETKREELKQNGDFRSPECVDLLKECDIVVTNPPFSLFREYIALLVKHKKDFIIIGNKNAITYKETFALIKDGKIKLGKTSPKTFATIRPTEGCKPSDVTKGLNGLTRWFTSFDISFAKDQVQLWKKYKGNEHLYPKYDNYDAINVDKIVDIPCDYFGKIGLPITCLDKKLVLADHSQDLNVTIHALGIIGSINFTENKKMEILKSGKGTGKFTQNAKGTLYYTYDTKRDKKPPAFKNIETGELYTSVYARVIMQFNK